MTMNPHKHRTVGNVLDEAGRRERQQAQRIAELMDQVTELTKERDYWRATTDDPGLYWNYPNPPYRLPHDEALIERAMPSPERFPPAEYLEETMRERGWTIEDLAEHAHLHIRVIEEVLYRGRPITQDLADRLATALDTSPELWLNLQHAYDERNEP